MKKTNSCELFSMRNNLSKFVKTALASVAIFAAVPLPAAAPPAPKTEMSVPTTANEFQIISRIQAEVQKQMTYISDYEHYGVVDKWVADPVDNKGDCEDFALTKMARLVNRQQFNVTRMQIKGVLAETGSGHAVLVIDNYYVLDNRFDDVKTVPQLVWLGYKGF